MKKILVGVAVVAFLVLLFFALNYYIYNAKQAHVALDYKNAEYFIEGERVKLVDGEAESEFLFTRYFGNEIETDLDGDGVLDIAFILTQESNGSGIFYYAVAALKRENGYLGSEGYFLGDRIAPQPTTLSPNLRHKNVVVFNYADRLPGEPMSTPPSGGKSVYLKIDPNTRQWGIVVPDFEGEAR